MTIVRPQLLFGGELLPEKRPEKMNKKMRNG